MRISMELLGLSESNISSSALCFFIIFSRLPWWFRLVVKNLPARQETQVRFLCHEDPLEKGMVTHSSTLGLENSMDSGAWQAIVHSVARSDTTKRLTPKHTHIFYITHKWPLGLAPIVGHIQQKITVLYVTLMTGFVVFVYTDGIKSWGIFYHRCQLLEKLMMTMGSKAATDVSCPR